MTTLIAFLLILALLILIHELGHFITAIKLGVDVEEFGIGFPPRLFSFKKGGIIYSLNLIPLGGFVKIKGESGEKDDDPKSFANQKAWKKTLIVSAGVIMNFMVAFILLSIGFYFGLPQALDNSTPDAKIRDRNTVIAEIMENSPAAQQGIEIGDTIVTINGKPVTGSEMVSKEIEANPNSEINLVVDRDDGEKQFSLKPAVLEGSQHPILGIGMIETGVIDYGFFGSIWQGLKVSILMVWLVIKAFYNLIVDLFHTGHLDERLSGPVGVAIMTGQMVRMGWIYTLQFMAILSVNLAVLNFLPFPALDGGRVLFIAIEKVSRRNINAKLEGWIHNTGFILLMIAVILITFRDINKYSSNILGFFRNIFS